MVLIHCLKYPSLRSCSSCGLMAAKFCKQPLRLFQQLRLQGTGQCPHERLECGDHFNVKPCEGRLYAIILKQPAPKALPENRRAIRLRRAAECCGNPCIDAHPRFDLLYYRRTDKLNREYQRTWAECPQMIQKPKLICCYEQIKYPEFKKRPPQKRPQTACEQSCAKGVPRCRYVSVRGCRPAQHPPRCRPLKKKSYCTKRKSPFPALSECKRNRRRNPHPIECRCLLKPMTCEVWAYHHYLRRIKKPSLC